MSNTDFRLAIVGMAVRFPGVADLDEYWQLLIGKRSVYGPLPAGRLDRELYYDPVPATPGKTYCDIAGVIPDDELDRERLGLSDKVLKRCDIAHLWFLDTALKSLENGGFECREFQQKRLGLFVGHVAGSHWGSDSLYCSSIETLTSLLGSCKSFAEIPESRRRRLVRRLISTTRSRYPQFDGRRVADLEAHSPAALVARRLKTKGPWMAVDAACASSFAALQVAAHWLRAGQIEMALVGGCSYTQWPSLVRFSQARALSPTGCFPFDSRGDGFVSSDGYAAILVEPLEQALARGHRIQAIIMSIGASCDGRGKSLWAPLKAGQVRAIERAYTKHLPPSSIQVVEAHATGTRVGDAVEIEALAEVFRNRGRDAIPLTAVKGHLGHTRETAGLAGLVKMILCMQNGIISPTAHFEPGSACSSIDWPRIPFRVVDQARPWVAQSPRRCAIDSFGIGGINYHVVLGDPGNARPEKAAVEGASLVHPNGKSRRMVAGSNRRSPGPVAVVGMGVVLPEMTGRESFLARLDQGAQFRTPDPQTRWDAGIYAGPAAAPYRVCRTRENFLAGWNFDWQRFKVPPRQAERTDPLQLMLLEAAVQCLDQASHRTIPIPERGRIGVYAGTIFHSDFALDIGANIRLAEFHRDLKKELEAAGLPAQVIEKVVEEALSRAEKRFPGVDESGSYSASTLASRICKQFDLQGPCLAIDAAESSAAAALLQAVEALRQGDCDEALCCAGQRSLHHTRLHGYEQRGWLADECDFQLAEGAAAVLLKRLGDVDPGGQPILAVIDEIQCAAWIDNPWRALDDVLHRSGSHHTPLLIQLFGDGSEGSRERQIMAKATGLGSSFRSVNRRLGLTQGASALVGLLDLIMAASGNGSGGPPTPALLNSIAFRGAAYQIHCRAGALPTGAAVLTEPVDARVFQLEETSLESLLEKLEQSIPDSEQRWSRSSPEPRPYSQRWRLGIVASDPGQLRVKLKLAQSLHSNFESWPALHEKGIFLHELPDTPVRVAWVFPGQGSAYAGMLRGHVSRFPAGRRSLDALNEILLRQSPQEQAGFEASFWAPGNEEEIAQDPVWSQSGVLFGGLVLASILRDLGQTPDLVLGHSFGEYAALVTAGVWSEETAICAAARRASILAEQVVNPGKLIATSARPELVQEIRSALAQKGHLNPANLNSPEQIVLAVENKLVTRAIEELESRGEVARVLPVPLPYHSILLEPAREAYKKALQDLALRPPLIPLLSGVDNRYLADPLEIRDALARQLITPLDFISMIRRCWDDGFHVFIEVGPRNVATRLIRSILKGRPVLAIPCDHPQIPAAEQILCVRTLLQTLSWGAGTATAVSFPDSFPVPSHTGTRHYPEPAEIEVLHLDATSRLDRSSEPPVKLRAGPIQPDCDSNKADWVSGLDELQQKLVKLVCQQTGYPPELVSMNQDLEADLGIDSIRKAQLLGEFFDQESAEISGSGPEEIDFGSILTLQNVIDAVRKWQSSPNHESIGATRKQPTSATEPEALSAKLPAVAPDGLDAFDRWVLRKAPAPLNLKSAPQKLPTLIVTCGKVAGCQALSARFESAGSPARVVGVHIPLSADDLRDRRRLVLLNSSRPAGLKATGRRLEETVDAELFALFQLLQNWTKALQQNGGHSGAELLAVTWLGGDFQLSPGNRAIPAGGAVTGLVKALSREFSGLKTKILDLPLGTGSTELARRILDELSDPDFEIEVGYTYGERIRVSTVAQVLTGSEACWSALGPESAWIISGGGRGITAFCAGKLAQQFGMTLHLLGTTPPDPVPEEWMHLQSQDWRLLRETVLEEARQDGKDPSLLWETTRRRVELHDNLRVFTDLGLRFQYHCVDVRDRRRVGQVVAAIRKQGIPIRGLIHGAGIEESCRFDRKRPDRVRDTLSTKILGLQNLLRVTRSDDLAAVVGFGSLSGRFGGVGQTDYSCASDLLAKLLSAYRHQTGIRCTTIHWPAWADIGMAARPESRFALERSGRNFLQPETGADFLLKELEAGLPESEVIVMDESYRVEAAAVHPSFDRATETKGPLGIRRVIRKCDPGLDLLELHLNPQRHPFLKDHQLNGQCLLPAAILIEIAVQAAFFDRTAMQSFRLKAVKLKRFLAIDPDGEQGLRVEVDSREERSRIGMFATRGGRPAGEAMRQMACLSAEIECLNNGPHNGGPVAPPRRLELFPVVYPSGPKACSTGQIYHGPSLRSLKSLNSREQVGWGRVRASDEMFWPEVGEGCYLSPTTLDACILACGIGVFHESGDFSVPVALEELEVHRPAGGDLWVRFECSRRTPDQASFNFQIGNEQGIVMRACGLTMKILRSR